MYLQHFGLRELPFSLTPDTEFFYAGRSDQEALNTLLIAARSGDGFIKITGEVGNGKTLLCRKFLSVLTQEYGEPMQKEISAVENIKTESAHFITIYLPNPYLEAQSLLHALAEAMDANIADTADQHSMLSTITARLLEYSRAGKRVLVCLDEAQAMPLPTLEVLRLLTNLETEKSKLLQVVLFGQPELDTHLAVDAIRQLRQRISFQYHLRPLDNDEVAQYVQHRLSVAGFTGVEVFEAAAMRGLCKASQGTPRLINLLAHKSLMLAFGEGKHRVNAQHVQCAVDDTPEAAQLTSTLNYMVIGAGLVLLAGIVLWWLGSSA